MINNDFFYNIKQLYTGKRKLVAYISSILILMTVIALIIFIVQKSYVKKMEQFERNLVLDNELLIPDGPQVQRGYITSREQKDKWSEDDINRWMKTPTDKELKELSSANDKIISEITGAAP